MVYDWDGRRAKRLLIFSVVTAVSIGISLPLLVTLWTYVA
jgi:hypothetical protein